VTTAAVRLAIDRIAIRLRPTRRQGNRLVCLKSRAVATRPAARHPPALARRRRSRPKRRKVGSGPSDRRQDVPGLRSGHLGPNVRSARLHSQVSSQKPMAERTRTRRSCLTNRRIEDSVVACGPSPRSANIWPSSVPWSGSCRSQRCCRSRPAPRRPWWCVAQYEADVAARSSLQPGTRSASWRGPPVRLSGSPQACRRRVSHRDGRAVTAPQSSSGAGRWRCSPLAIDSDQKALRDGPTDQPRQPQAGRVLRRAVPAIRGSPRSGVPDCVRDGRGHRRRGPHLVFDPRLGGLAR
jgi:hypothetical protein